MAEATTAKGLGFLTQKAGPLPLWGWLAIGGGLWWYLNRNNQAAAGSASTALVTDPAGNTCSVLNPDTGYCPGTAEDTAAIAALGQTGSTSSSTGTPAGGDSGTLPTDTSGAASSGAPSGGPAPAPAPASAPSVPSTAPAPNTKWAYPKPASISAYSVAANGYRVRWSPVRGPAGQVPGSYTVATYNAKGALADQFTVGGTDTAEYGKGGGGLPAGTYTTNVWANGGPQAPEHASVSVTLKGK